MEKIQLHFGELICNIHTAGWKFILGQGEVVDNFINCSNKLGV